MKKVYISFASDIIHSGHINILNRAAELGEVTAGVMTNEAVSAFDRYPITSLEERMKVLKNLKSVARVVVQDTVNGAETLRELRPDIVVHGDNWQRGPLAEVRQRILGLLSEWGGELVEFPYTYDESLTGLELCGPVLKERNGRK